MTISISKPYSGDQTNAPFARKIADARTSSGYTIDQLALTCGLTVQEISALETGADNNPDRIKRVAAALQIPISTII